MAFILKEKQVFIFLPFFGGSSAPNPELISDWLHQSARASLAAVLLSDDVCLRFAHRYGPVGVEVGLELSAFGLKTKLNTTTS